MLVQVFHLFRRDRGFRIILGSYGFFTGKILFADFIADDLYRRSDVEGGKILIGRYADHGVAYFQVLVGQSGTFTAEYDSHTRVHISAGDDLRGCGLGRDLRPGDAS